MPQEEPMIATVAWTCPSCRGAVSTPYCPECGERALRAHDLTLRGLAEQVFEAFTTSTAGSCAPFAASWDDRDSDRCLPAWTAQALYRTRGAIPDHEPAVLRDGIADRRNDLLDAARRASSPSAVEWPRPRLLTGQSDLRDRTLIARPKRAASDPGAA